MDFLEEITIIFITSTIVSIQFSFSSVVKSYLTLWPHGLEHSRPPCLSPIPRVYPDSCLLSLLCCPLLLPPWIFPRISVASNESAFCIRGPKYWSFSFTISPSKEIPGLISFRMDWLDLLAVQGTLKSHLQHHSSEASILWRSAFFIFQISHPYMTTRKTIALTRQTLLAK